MTAKVVRSRDKFLEAIDASYGALITAIEATEARGDRVSKTLLAEARKGEKELSALARSWVDAPASVYENLEAMIDAQARAQRRALELARESVNGAGAYRSEVRDALRQMIKANRAAGDVILEALREATSRAAQQAERLPRPRRLRPHAVRPSRVPVAASGVPRKLTG
jgi:hypothetical protein